MPDSGPAAAGLFSPDHLSAARPHGNHRRDATPSRDNRKPAAHRLAYRRQRGPRPSISMRTKALSVHVRAWSRRKRQVQSIPGWRPLGAGTISRGCHLKPDESW